MEEKVGLGIELKNTPDYARFLDEQDPLKSFRDKFYIPLVNGKEAIYFTGNSLGLQPKTTQDYVLNEMENWANYGVEGHHHGENPWIEYHEMFPALLTKIFGGKEEELVVMNSLTVNLHLLMTSFYRPTKERFKIICEAKAFPSDQYAFASQVKLHGYEADEAIIEVSPRDGEFIIRTEDILSVIDQHKDSVAMVLFGGINYYNGQVFDMASITKAAHAAGATCGFDLAHAAGNIELHLHDWDVDFACWCSYKYMNSGPGGVAGIFIHERHMADNSIPRLAGWWGHDKENRFKMDKEFVPIPTAEGWQLSNTNILSMASYKASLDIFEEAGMQNLIKKSKALTNYLFFVLDEINKSSAEKLIEIITPRNDDEHGCQVSMLMLKDGRKVFEELKKRSVICDWREPNVIRAAPVPLYNSFEDVFRFGEILREFLSPS